MLPEADLKQVYHYTAANAFIQSIGGRGVSFPVLCIENALKSFQNGEMRILVSAQIADMRLGITFAILLFAINHAMGQATVVELRNALAKTSIDTVKMRLYHQLALIYAERQPAEAIALERKVLTIAETGGYTERIAEAHKHIGIVYRMHSEYRNAIDHYRIALQTAEKNAPHWNATETCLELGIAYLRIWELDSAAVFLEQGFALNHTSGNRRMQAQLHNMAGNVAKERGEFKNALGCYIKSADIFEELSDNDGLTQAVSNIGNMHYIMGNYGEAEKYALKSLNIAEDINKKMSIAYSNRLLGRIYRQQQRLDEALLVYFKAIGIYEQLSATRDIGETHLNRGNIYFEKQDFRAALQEYFSAIRAQKKAQDTFTMAYTYSAAGQTYQALNNIRDARIYLDSAMMLANRKNIPVLKADLYDILSYMYAEARAFKLAYEYHVMYSNISDSLGKAGQREEARALAARYESEKKESEIRTLNAENDVAMLQLKQRNNERKYLIAFSLLAVALAAVIYNRYQIKSRTTKKLREVDEMKSRFFANLSHEFRTPLSLITIPLVKKLATNNQDQQTLAVQRTEVEMMYRNASRLQRMIDQLLDLSRIEAGKMQLDVTRGDLGRLIRIIFASFQSLAEQKDVAFELVINGNLHEIYFDHDKIEKILYNLLSNAFKFTPPGKSVSLIAASGENDVSITVVDSGIGIPADKLPHIFDRFYQADNAIIRAREGSGIGLSLSRELAEIHRGTLTVKSDPEIGSEFTVVFPVHAHAYKGHIFRKDITTNPINAPLELVSVQATDEFSASGRPIALVAEDHPDMQDVIRDVLQDQFNVIVCADGPGTWEKALGAVPDIIVCDIMMPGMDGITLCGKLKTHHATSHIPVVMLTARGDQESRLSGLENGADDYLTKPFDPRELVVRVSNLVAQRRRLREFYRLEMPSGDSILPPAENAFLGKVSEALERRYTDPEFRLEEFCLEMGMSRMQLHRKLKALTDKSPGEFLRAFRINRACQLLTSARFQVSEVAYNVGYNNLSHFTKTFREQVGCNPSEFSRASGKKLENNT